jgi:diguanylate cyclase (GGDEF)-like protein
METESYFIFALWSLLGFIYFRMILRRDSERRYGNSIIVWISLFSLIMFISLVWLCRSILSATGDGMSAIESYYTSAAASEAQAGVVSAALDGVRIVTSQVVITVVLLIATSLAVLISNYNIVTNRVHLSEHELHRIREVVSRDALTGVKSRQAFIELERQIDELIAAGAAGDFGVVVCDMNGLKQINDHYGHKVGDEFLKEASQLICNVFSHSPVYRTGGDEFVVYLSGRDFLEKAELMVALEEQSKKNIASGAVSVAAGESDFLPGDTCFRVIFDRADKEMYINKRILKSLGTFVR